MSDDIAQPGIKMERGVVTVFDRPGYGVDLDEKRMKKYGGAAITVS